MPSWSDLLEESSKVPPENQGAWFHKEITEFLRKLSAKRGNRNVIVYASGFLQKPQVAPMFLQISHEDINGFMSVMYQMDWARGLTLVLHTPGGVTNATETIVEYLMQKFNDIEVIIPTYAMSAGTMISLAANRIVMGRQSQLGPIDPQMPFNGRMISARAVVDQFERAKEEIIDDVKTAAVWAPALQHLGPSLLKEAIDALDYSEAMVSKWLAERQFAQREDATQKAAAVASYFNRSETHKSHGRRIDREEAKGQDLDIQNLEDDKELQDLVLTLYHLITLTFEKSPSCKCLINNEGRAWVKNM